MVIVFALIAFVGWGTGDIFGGLVSRKIGGYSSAFWQFIFGVLFSSLLIPFMLPQLKLLTLGTFLILFVLSVGYGLALISLYEGIRVGKASLVGTIAASFGVMSVILSVIFFNDRLSIYQIIAIAATFVGLVLSSLDLRDLNPKKIVADRGILYAFITLLIWSIYYTFLRIPVRQVGWFWPSYLSTIISIPVIFIFAKLNKHKIKFPKGRKLFSLAVLNTFLLTVAVFAYNIAILSGKTSIVAPIAGSYPVLFAILAYFVFKDRLRRQQIIGIFITLFGIILLSFVN